MQLGSFPLLLGKKDADGAWCKQHDVGNVLKPIGWCLSD
jgi:hypothetical protein